MKNPNYEVSWIGRVSDEVTSTLSKWGFSPNDPNNKNRLRVVGHSLGSILSGEISQRYGGAKSLIALDPPSESISGTYKVYINPDQNRKNFNEYAQFSRSFVGKNSFAGNQDFAKTANEKFVMNFYSTADSGTEHSLVVKTFERLISDQQINVSQAYTQTNTNWPIRTDTNNSDIFYSNGSYDGFDTEITVVGETNNTRTIPNSVTSGLDIYGGSTNDTIQSYSAGTTNMRGNGGGDIFENYGIVENINQKNKIIDFSDTGDKISLKKQSPIGFGVNNNTYTVYSGCGIGPGCPNSGKATISKSVNGGASREEIVVEGGRVGVINWQDELNLAKTNQSTVITLR
jgi:hypothetical protein